MVLRTLDIDLYNDDFPLSEEKAECGSCGNETMGLTRDQAKSAPWICRVCDSVYIPAPENIDKGEVKEILKRLLKGNVKRRPECDSCKETVKREDLAARIDEIVEETESIKNSILYHMSNVEDISYWECPHCGEPASFLKESKT